MKGAIFIALNQMVEDRLGIECWESLLSKVKPLSQGIYTSVDSYDDGELFDLVTALSEITGKPIGELVESFGEYLFGVLNSKYPIFTKQQAHFFDFIDSIDSVIHKEVRKLYESPNLPSLSCQQLSDSELRVEYRSPRKLCLLAEGLIRGAAVYYQVAYQLTHDQCMHNQHDHCVFHIQLTGKL